MCGATPAEAAGGHRLPRQQAAHERFWQPNPRNRVGVLVCDCDEHDPLAAVFEGRAPAPTALLWNLHNGHSHALYVLADPVGMGGDSSPAAARFAEVVWQGLETALEADPAYTGLLSRGPLAEGHQLEAISGRAYELRELAAAIPLPPRVAGLNLAAQHADSRNRACFDHVRQVAYQHAHLDDADLLAVLTSAARQFNLMHLVEHARGPLPDREVTTICRSVYRWTVPRRAALTPRLPGAVDRSRQHSKDRAAPAPEATQKARQAAAGAMTATRRREGTRAEIRAAVTLLRSQGQQVTSKALVLVTGLSRPTLNAHRDLWDTEN